MAVLTLDLRDVFLFFFRNNINSCDRGVVANTLFLYFAALETSLVVLVLFTGLVLIGGLSTKHVKREKISEFNLSEVFLPFFCRLISLGTLNVNFTSI